MEDVSAYGDVAIITRTKDRPLTLRRALQSVANQNFDGSIIWVVCDDGELTSAEWIVEAAKQESVRCLYIKVQSMGYMEVGSNSGISASQSKYVVVHDDDDTWDPNFLAETTSYLQVNPEYQGVVSLTTQIFEIIEASSIKFVSKVPYNPGLKSIYLSEMAKFNLFPPISFLYRRDALDAVGVYEESFPVLGDWDFNLRFLLHFNIGVVDKFLANYHWRVSDSSHYGNSVTAHQDQHEKYDSIIRNHYLRQDVEQGKLGLGFVTNQTKLSTSHSSLFYDYDRFRRILFRLRVVKWLFRKLRNHVR
jgi:glycosyltransferase involved in cell wall biosynthesis